MVKNEESEFTLELIHKMGGYIDDNNMLQLEKGFCIGEKIPPHGKIFQEIASSVEKVYGETGLCGLGGEKGRMIHQFRMYIDRHNIAYIRNNFKKEGMSDEEALKAYVDAPPECGGLGGVKMLREPARFHNKYPADLSYWKYQRGKENKKRLTPDFHSEFIIDREGNFVSQWNVLEEDVYGKIISDIEYYRRKYCGEENETATIPRKQTKDEQKRLKRRTMSWEEVQRQIMDTESFNYASRNDSVHQRLDIKPPGEFDPDIRRQIARDWKSPCKHAKTLGDLKNRYCYGSDKNDAYSV